MFKECGDCTVCCDGWLEGNAYGNNFGYQKPCVFLCKQTCSIYSTRPSMCAKYQCAWSQGLFPDWMKPTESQVLISVENKHNKQFLKVIQIGNISPKVKTFLDEWVKQHNTYYIIGNKSGIEN